MIRELLDLTVEIGEAGSQEYNREYLDLLVRGELPLAAWPLRPEGRRGQNG